MSWKTALHNKKKEKHHHRKLYTRLRRFLQQPDRAYAIHHRFHAIFEQVISKHKFTELTDPERRTIDALLEAPVVVKPRVQYDPETATLVIFVAQKDDGERRPVHGNRIAGIRRYIRNTKGMSPPFLTRSLK